MAEDLGSGTALSTAEIDAIHGLNVYSAQTEFENQRYAERMQNETLLRRAFRSAEVFTGAGLYLLDLVSNILVLQVYWQEVYIKGNFEGSMPNSLGPEITAFAVCLTFLISSQIVALVVFKLHLPPEQYPFRLALILPLVQLYRLVKEICRSLPGCGRDSRGSERWESSEAESLFAIMSALETSLQIPLQITYIVLTGIVDEHWHPSSLLVLSVVASFLSGAYNAGLGIMYQSSLRWGIMLNPVGIAGGLYTVGSLLLRSLAVASISASSEVSGIHHSKLLLAYLAIMGPIHYCFGLISLGRTAKLFTCEAQLRAWISFFYYELGPVYPMLEGFYKKTHSTRLQIIGCLLMVAIFNLLLDVLTFSIMAERRWGFCNFSKERLPFPDLPYLSSTLKCSRFIQLTSIGAALSVVSLLALCYILFRSSVEDFRVNLRLDSTSEFLNFTRAEVNASMSTSDNIPETESSLRSRSMEHQSRYEKKMPLGIMRVNFSRFSSRIASFDHECARMVSINPRPDPDAKASRSEVITPPSGNLTIGEAQRKCIHSPSRRFTIADTGEDPGPDPPPCGTEDGEVVQSGKRVFERTESIRSGQGDTESVELRNNQSRTRTSQGLTEDRETKSASSGADEEIEAHNGFNFLPRGSVQVENSKRHEVGRWTLSTSREGQPEGVEDNETSHLKHMENGTEDSTAMILRDHGSIMRALFTRSSSAGERVDEQNNRVKRRTGNKPWRSLGEGNSFTL